LLIESGANIDSFSMLRSSSLDIAIERDSAAVANVPTPLSNKQVLLFAFRYSLILEWTLKEGIATNKRIYIELPGTMLRKLPR